VTINHAVVQDIAGLIVGVNGAAPASMYVASLGGLGGGTGYTGCGSVTFTGGTTASQAASAACYVDSAGVLHVYTINRGFYSVCPTGVSITGTGGSGATLSATPVCSAGGGTAAINVANTTAGVLTIAADTYVRGTVQLRGGYNQYSTALAVNPGANFFMDMTQAAGAMYRIEFPAYVRQIAANCSSQHIPAIDNRGCSIQGYGGSTTVEYYGGNGAMYGGWSLNNVYLKNIGDVNSEAIQVDTAGATIRAINIVNSTLDTCGRVMFYGSGSATESIILSGNVFKNTPDWTISNIVTGAMSTAPTTGTFQITNNVFDHYVGDRFPGATITGNVFNGGMNIANTASAAPATFQYNFIRQLPTYAQNIANPNNGFGVLWAGPLTNSYVLLDMSVVSNPHWFSGNGIGTSAAVGSIFGFSGKNAGDSGEILGSSTQASIPTATNSLFLCDSTNVGSSEATSVMGTTTSLFLHNTFCGGYGGWGMVDTNETTNTPAGSLTMKSNLIFETAQGKGLSMKVMTGTPGNQNVCTTTDATTSNCDYNAGYSPVNAALGYTLNPTVATCAGCTNQGRSYAGLWSYTPGYHDVDGQNPMFADSTRKMENWDRKYLGNALSPQYVAGNTYNYGDLVSNSDSGLYLGETLNFRCIDPAGCTNDPAPGPNYASAYAGSGATTSVVVNVASLHLSSTSLNTMTCSTGSSTVTPLSFTPMGSPYLTSVTVTYASNSGVTCYVFSPWRASWEWASLYWLRSAVVAGTTYTDGAINCTGCGPVQAMNNWVRAGFVSQNPRLWGAGHDGSDIGAVSLSTVRRLPAGALLP
jgi:hypothetical protein